MKYIITSEFNNTKVTVETNDVRTACAEFLIRVDDADRTCICDGTTGEVLANTGDNPYCTEEFGLTLLGHLMEEAWGENDRDDEPVDPAVALASSLFGISVDETVALHNVKGLFS